MLAGWIIALLAILGLVAIGLIIYFIYKAYHKREHDVVVKPSSISLMAISEGSTSNRLNYSGSWSPVTDPDVKSYNWTMTRSGPNIITEVTKGFTDVPGFNFTMNAPVPRVVTTNPYPLHYQVDLCVQAIVMSSPDSIVIIPSCRTFQFEWTLIPGRPGRPIPGRPGRPIRPIPRRQPVMSYITSRPQFDQRSQYERRMAPARHPGMVVY